MRTFSRDPSLKVVEDKLCQKCGLHPWSAITVIGNMKRCFKCFIEYYTRKKESDAALHI